MDGVPEEVREVREVTLGLSLVYSHLDPLAAVDLVVDACIFINREFGNSLDTLAIFIENLESLGGGNRSLRIMVVSEPVLGVSLELGSLVGVEPELSEWHEETDRLLAIETAVDDGLSESLDELQHGLSLTPCQLGYHIQVHTCALLAVLHLAQIRLNYLHLEALGGGCWGSESA